MAPEKTEVPDITLTSSKKEMLAAYKELVKRLQDKREVEMKPEQKIEEKRNSESVEVAEALSLEGVGKEIASLKSEIGKTLTQLSDKLEQEIEKYVRARRGAEIKEKELREIYEIEKSASTFTALLEAQKEKRQLFEADMAERKKDLDGEILVTRAGWKEEQETHEAGIKQRDSVEKKAREREAEEYRYKFEREKQLAKEEFEYQNAKMEREIQFKKEEMEKDLAAREKAILEREAELAQLRDRMQAFPKELETSVAKAVKEATERVKSEFQSREELLKKEFQGEQNVLKSRIEAFRQTVESQTDQIAKLSAQIEKSYGQVQEIAVKAIEGSGSAKVLASVVSQVAESSRHAAQGEGSGKPSRE